MSGPVVADLLITNALVVTLDPDQPVWNDAYLAVAGDRISGVGPMSELSPDFTASEVIDGRDRLVMPGLINAHTHAAMTIFRGLADDLPLMAWLNEHIFPAEAAHVGPELVYWGARLACAEMLLSGTTCLADGYFFEDEAARAVQDSGLRAVLAQGVLDFPAPGVPDPARNIEVAERFIASWRDRSPLIRPSVFAHSPYTCSRETLVRSRELARRHNVVWQIHLAETSGEVERMRQERGMSPAAWLDSLGLLDEQVLAVHCVHLNPADIDLLKARGVSVALCPESNMKLASGLPPVDRLMAAGVNLALGTDGAASNNDLNLFGELRTLALAAKAATLDPTVAPAAGVLALTGPGGSKALGWGEELGAIRPGRRADLITLDRNQPHMQPLYHPHSHLVYAATGREVTDVVVGGRVRVRERRLVGQDLEEILFMARELAFRVRPS